MKIKIKGKEFDLHYSMRIHILYENVMNQTLSNVSVNSTTGLIVLMYCAVIGSMQYHKINVPVSYDEFMDWLDAQDPTVFAEFGKWFKESVDLYASLANEKSEESKEKKAEVDTKNV